MRVQRWRSCLGLTLATVLVTGCATRESSARGAAQVLPEAGNAAPRALRQGPLRLTRATVSTSSIELEIRPWERSDTVPGDPLNGARLYRIHCAPCHGFSGKGDGAAASYLYPRPRDHTDPVHMNRRSDQLLHDVIALGGPALGLSALMPRWNEIFGGHQIWDLVAYVRSLYQPLSVVMNAAARAVPVEVVLSDALAAELARPTDAWAAGTGSRKITYFSVPPEESTTESDDDEEQPAPVPAESLGAVPDERALFGEARLLGVSVPMAVSLRRDGTLVKARTYPRVVLNHRGFRLRSTVDRFLDAQIGHNAAKLAASGSSEEERLVAGPLVEAIGRLARRLALAQQQEALDAVDAQGMQRQFGQHPAGLSAGAKVFMQACAPCHGPTGKGARVPGPYPGLRSRNLSDGAHLNPLTDDHIGFLVSEGGESARLSPAMPSFRGVLDDAQIQQVVAHVRGLARPRGSVRRAP